MIQALFHFILSFLVALGTIAVLIPLTQKFGWLDQPDARKQHEQPTPAVGGLGVFLGLVAVALVYYPLTYELLSIGFAALLLVLTGVWDDRFHMDWKPRILIQLLATLIVVYGTDIRIEHLGALLGVGTIDLQHMSVPLTVFITLALINVLNMCDGVDGLLGGMTSAVTLMLICAAAYSGAYLTAVALCALLGALLGFLWFNLRRPGLARARVFMGDTGSALLGFLLAFVVFHLTQNPHHPVSPVLGPYLLAPPIIDGLVIIVRRVCQGRSPFAADREHAHHLMLDAGFSVSDIVLLMTTLTFATGLLGAVFMLLDTPEPVMILVYVCMTLWWFWLTSQRTRALAFLSAAHRRLSPRAHQ